MAAHKFKPPIYMRPAGVQTLLASLKIRKRGANPMLDAASDIVIDTKDGVRLKASISRAPNAKGSIVFLHGWEGSQDSTYVVSCGRHLYNAGYNVVRLNYRDHGDSHYLNEGLFYAGRFTEIFNAVKYACELDADVPSYLVGFSLGGNFALRVVREIKTNPIKSLAHVFSISPVINPYKASPYVDNDRLVQRYFYKKWSTSLRKKQAFFPQLYNFDEILKDHTIMGLSQKLISKYMNFQGIKDFFDAYRVWPDDLLTAKTPTSIIMAKKDPVLPPEDIWELNLPGNIERIMLPYGGHNGFFDSILGPTWYDRFILETIS